MIAYLLFIYLPKRLDKAELKEIFLNSEITCLDDVSTKRLYQVYDVKLDQKSLLVANRSDGIGIEFEGPSPDYIYFFVPIESLSEKVSFDLYRNTILNRILIRHQGNDSSLSAMVKRKFILSKESLEQSISFLEEPKRLETLIKLGEYRNVARIFSCSQGNQNLNKKTPFGNFTGFGLAYYGFLAKSNEKEIVELSYLLIELSEVDDDTSN